MTFTMKTQLNLITMKLKYNLKNKKYKEGKENLSEDFCDDLKDYAKSLSSMKSNNNIYKKVENFKGKEKTKFRDKLKKKLKKKIMLAILKN